MSKKRSNLQETVKEAEYELEELNKKLEEKKQMFDGEEILKGEEVITIIITLIAKELVFFFVINIVFIICS